ncbi:kinesin-like protein KIN-6 isoform X2 [Chenopodium quinoa]|uniref:kinesin-like protein KIN-6 isoform X2 n=1 Tax=Chenopodium quinoa TaxID=63459 RepID=UPI000B783EDD|nr:kinesin-like protein KIN-6 isoform X2 [Chenopodium quinoa]
MQRKMEESSPQQCQTTVTIRRNPPRRARPSASKTAAKSPSSHSLSSKNLNIPNFPLDDILSIDVQLLQNPKIPSPNQPDSSNSLNVFLRVRPLPIAPSKSKQPISKKPSKSCLTINDDSHSITIIPPICDSNRLKSEVYNGFSHVFSSDSSQDEVYDKLMRPMVERFLNKKSGLLAALGPSGSGKTHTVFGSVNQPGLVPRALRHIFDAEASKSSMISRSFYLSIFEIYSEKGKGEKLSDLSPDGSDIYLQQSAVKGLKEVLIKDVAQAEYLLNHAKSKRVTAMTNSNSQSSRSQCIINIRCTVDETVGRSESMPNEAVLTFVDLAGAEREKKTGNKGGRLLESNFINNTSMVFGLCLRSLLEHQKNPKKPMQKHFQSSLLTRYLRDYMEGRKRMALILTVRPGEEDYFDTSFLLRQASPYMQIKFCDVEETSYLPRNKKRHQTIGNEQKKRTKLTRTESAVCRNDAETTHRDLEDSPKEELKTLDNSYGNKRPLQRVDENLLPKVDSANSNIYRQYYVMQGFAKALWSVLKQYKERVKTMEKDIDILKENLRIGDAKYLAIEKELLDLKSQRSYQNQGPGVASYSIGGPNLESRFSEEELSDTVKVVSADIKGLAELANLECKEITILHTSGEKCTTVHDYELEGVTMPEEKHEYSNSECKSKNLSWEKDVHFEGEVGDPLSPEAGCQCTDFEGRPPGNSNQDKEIRSGSIKESQGSGSINVSKIYIGDLPSGPKGYLSVDESINPDVILTRPSYKANLSSPDLKMSLPQSYQISLMECEISHDTSISDHHEKDQRKECDNKSTDAAACLSRSHVLDLIDQGESCGCDTKIEKDKENVASVPGSNFNSELETKEASHSKSSKAARPKRRLMPASSLLLRDASSVDVTDEIEKLKGGRGGRKLVEDDHKRTTGSASLMRLLKNHLPR